MTKSNSEVHVGFEVFRSRFKPLVRPAGTLPELACIFRLDANFTAEFKYLRRYLLADKINWAEDIVSHLLTLDALSAKMDVTNLNILRNLYRTHVDVFRMGKFGEEYLDSVEDVALFFIYHDVKSLWLAGSYRELSARLIELVCRRRGFNKNLPIRGTMRALTAALLIELNQIQRTYTMYERNVGRIRSRPIGDGTGQVHGLHPSMLKTDS